MLSDKNNEVSCLNVHNQNLEYQIRKSNNDKETPYISNHKLEEEIKCLKQLIVEKDTELAQVCRTLEIQEADIGRLQQDIQEFQQKNNDTKKVHKLEITKFNNTLTSNTE